MSVKDRIAAKKAAASAGAPVSPPGAAQKQSRSQRFTSAGVVDETPPQESEPTATAPESAPPLAQQNATRSPTSRADRLAAMFANRPSTAPAERGVAPQTYATDDDAPLLDWGDDNRPAGSGYTEEEWAAAEAASPGMTVFEVLKTDERALISKEPDALDVLLRRSLLVHSKVESDWLNHSSALIEHHGEFGLQRYRLIRSRVQAEKSPEYANSKTVIRDPGYEEAPPDNRSRARSERFRG